MKEYLLDTHTLIWFLEGNNLLPENVRNIIINTENKVLISIATLWEMSIKISIGKLSLSRSLEEIIRKLSDENIAIIPIEPSDVLRVLTMPFHHKDPFDRIIVAQSMAGNITVLSNEQLFDQYGVLRLW